MKRRKVIAGVVEPGQCEYYKAGRSFALNGFTPQGLCDSAYAVLSRDAQVLGRILAELVCNARDREPLAAVSARMDPERLLDAALKGFSGFTP